MAIDVSTLVNMVHQTSPGTQHSRKSHGGFVTPSAINPNPGGFGDMYDAEYEAKMEKMARLNPNMQYYSQKYGGIVRGWALRDMDHQPHWPRSVYDSVLSMVQNHNDTEAVRVTAPPGTYEHSAQVAERMANPVRSRRKTARQVLGY